MPTARITAVVIAIGGLLSSPWVLDSARAARPPIGWIDLPFVLFGTFFGVLFVVGLQARMKRDRGVIYAWGLFSITGLFCTTAGFGAVVYALATSGLDPAAFFFLAIAVGVATAGALTKPLFRESVAARSSRPS